MFHRILLVLFGQHLVIWPHFSLEIVFILEHYILREKSVLSLNLKGRMGTGDTELHFTDKETEAQRGEHPGHTARKR